MKRLLIALAALLSFALPATAQDVVAYRIIYGATLPAVCNPASGDVFFRTATNIGIHNCTATNTWTYIGVGGGSTLFPNGTAAAPSIAFANSPTTGFFRSAADVIGMTAAGTERATLSSTGVTVTSGILLVPAGAAGAPSLALAATNTGFFQAGATQIALATGNELLLQDGTAATPALVFDSDTGDGWFRPGAEQWALSIGGVEALNFANASTTGAQLTWTDQEAFAALGTPADGTIKYCSDCTVATPCAGAGTGAFAFRINGAWDCSP